AHRIILVSNSEYFGNMLQGGWKEQHMKLIPIKETRFDTFRMILYYLYSGKLMDTSLVTLCDVFRQGDMMMLDDLKDLVARKMKMLINDDTWDEILLLAWKTKDFQLKNIGLEYAFDNWERVKKGMGLTRLFETSIVEQLEELFFVINKRKEMVKWQILN
ncbi:12351_t:CDS:1, partial [Funneliformis geosporum]